MLRGRRMDGLSVREVRAGAASAIVAESVAIPPRIQGDPVVVMLRKPQHPLIKH